jgi:agmatinase
MRRVYEMELPIVQIGIRSLSQDEYIFSRAHNLHSFGAAEINAGRIPAQVLPWDFPEQIYITFDVDCFDAAIMPATGTPEPGGLTWYQVMELLHKVSAKRTVCGFDVVELAPIPAMHAPDFTAAKLVYKLMGLAVS